MNEGILMVRFHLIFIGFACGLTLCSFWVYGQPPQRQEETRNGEQAASADSDGRRGSREREPFFEAMREIHMENSNRELLDLVRHASVRQEIHLSDEDSERLFDNGREAFQAIHAIRAANEGLATSKEELKQQIRDALAPLEAESFEILQKPGVDFQRLLGIYVQVRNYRALLNDKVAEQIGLQGQALVDFRQFRSEAWRTIMEDTRRSMEKEIRNTPPGLSAREEIGKLFRRAEEKLDEKLAGQLTDAQRNALQNLKGANFDQLPERPFSFPQDRRRGRRDEPLPSK